MDNGYHFNQWELAYRGFPVGFNEHLIILGPIFMVMTCPYSLLMGNTHVYHNARLEYNYSWLVMYIHACMVIICPFGSSFLWFWMFPIVLVDCSVPGRYMHVHVPVNNKIVVDSFFVEITQTNNSQFLWKKRCSLKEQ